MAKGRTRCLMVFPANEWQVKKNKNRQDALRCLRSVIEGTAKEESKKIQLARAQNLPQPPAQEHRTCLRIYNLPLQVHPHNQYRSVYSPPRLASGSVAGVERERAVLPGTEGNKSRNCSNEIHNPSDYDLVYAERREKR